MKKNIEIAAFNLESALVAAEALVDRIEFCANYEAGGVTPSVQDFQLLRVAFPNPIFVMIRPRGGDFVYSKAELLQMENSIIEFGKLGANGFVFGVLNDDNEIDIEPNNYLLDKCNGLPVTFHRAFDRVKDSASALETIIECGFNNILSSGGEKCVLDGVLKLVQLQKQANGRINFIAGGGVRGENLSSLIGLFETDFYHSSAIIDTSDLANANELRSLIKIVKSC